MKEPSNQRAVIFDVDGTLVDSEQLDAQYFVMAVREVLGGIEMAYDWKNYKKVTDIGIIAEILEKNGMPVEQRVINDIRERFRTLLQRFFKQGGVCRPIEGADRLLLKIREMPGFSIGIATGGWKVTALMKLEAAGIPLDAIPISSSDDADERTDIMLNCLDRLGGRFERIVYFGDGVWDRNASERLGWSFIGVGEKLRGKCEVWFEDFRRTGEIIEAIEDLKNLLPRKSTP